MTRAFNVLVTGGAGYVGSHTVAALLDRGHRVTVFDDLSQGHPSAILPGAAFVQGDLADRRIVAQVLADGRFDAILHFAARSLVGESMRDPHLYLHDNVVNALNLVQAAVATGVRRFVLSSTANLFGTPDRIPIDEDVAIDPGSPYGESKYMVERILHWADRCHGLRSACLRYFNAAGADPAGRLGEDHAPETHLIPLVIDAALGRRAELSVFGDDYPTPDGTCVRDYVHVGDLADAHVRVLDVLDGRSVRYNLGNGTGFSVRAVIAAAERVTGRPVPHRIADRRPGDPPVLIASSARIRADLGWRPAFADLDRIIETAWRWRLAHPQGYGDARSRTAAA
jgi:UDP-glucose 4-epimerase